MLALSEAKNVPPIAAIDGVLKMKIPSPSRGGIGWGWDFRVNQLGKYEYVHPAEYTCISECGMRSAE